MVTWRFEIRHELWFFFRGFFFSFHFTRTAFIDFTANVDAIKMNVGTNSVVDFGVILINLIYDSIVKLKCD